MSKYDFSAHRLRQLRTGPPFSHEAHYAALSAAISIITTLTLHYFISKDLQTNEITESLISESSKYIPAIKKLELIQGIDVQHWKTFFSVQFALLPIHFLLGIASGFFIDEHLKNEYKKISKVTIFLGYLVSVACIPFLAYAPLVNLGPPYGWCLDQLNDFPPKLILAWLMLSMLAYGIGNLTIAIISKSYWLS